MTALEQDAQALRRALQGDGDEVSVTLSRGTAEMLAGYLDAQAAAPGSDDSGRQHAAVADLFAMQNGWD